MLYHFGTASCVSGLDVQCCISGPEPLVHYREDALTPRRHLILPLVRHECNTTKKRMFFFDLVLVRGPRHAEGLGVLE